MTDIALVTANFGGIDDLKAVPRQAGIDTFYYTDQATLERAAPGVSASWTRVLTPNYPRHDFGARIRSRYFKHQIHRLDEVKRHRWLVWADGSLQLHEIAFLLEQADNLRRLPPRKRILLVPHPERRTVREEYEYISGEIHRGSEYLRERYAEEKMPEQMEHYRRCGWNLEARLWCGGFWMVENSAVLNRCWDDWWDQIIRFGMMDQLSLPVMLDDHGCDPQSLNVSVWQNVHFSYVAHPTAS